MMKRYKKLNVDICKCYYCGASIITLEDVGQCPKGCSSRMNIKQQETFYIDMKTGNIEYCINKEQSEEDLIK